ncbi:hypothetical protein [Actinokineospora sp.]|uniref:hypothetical protein n=1 Tax=Actinokineospora sp. TaxID=1872133 RepID=UPI0040377AF5
MTLSEGCVGSAADGGAGRFVWPVDEKRFAEVIQSMVSDHAPKLFAIIEEFGERDDAQVVAWGMEFPGRAHVVGDDGRMRMSSSSAQTARDLLGITGTMRLVWC